MSEFAFSNFTANKNLNLNAERKQLTVAGMSNQVKFFGRQKLGKTFFGRHKLGIKGLIIKIDNLKNYSVPTKVNF